MIKKIMTMLSLLLGLTGTLCAQEKAGSSHEDQLFELPYFSISSAWHIDLGKGNYIELELTGDSQFSRFLNMDSLLLVFLGDMKPFRDSLSDPVSGKRIDYLVDSAGRKIVRIRETRPSGASFLLGEEQPSLLRMQQDTIYILLQAPAAIPIRKEAGPRYNRLTIVINRWDQLENLVSAGLNNKMQEFVPAPNHRYADDFGGGGHLISDPSVTIKREGPYAAGHSRDFVELEGVVDVQNYKNYFVPSVGLGASLGFKRGNETHLVGLLWEPNFIFGADAQGHQQTYRNDLLVFSYGFERIDPKTQKPVGLSPNISFGWFIHHEGELYEKNTYRLTTGSLKLMNGRIMIQPGIYFNDFFRGVTPTLRLSFKFL
ncbi:MAG TPA: hypothetical protein VNU70_01315 [Puia sp.]|jgi:hypothetical protein|nr:hypothetical protein [Puia sp.]